MDLYQRIIHHRTYAKPIHNRLETYEETCDRLFNFLKKEYKNYDKVLKELDKIEKYIKGNKIASSMRLFFSAGEAVRAENAMAFNCKYQAIYSLKSFSDLLYSLLCTCGVGISVRKQHIDMLPKVPQKIIKTEKTIYVIDTRSGWATALNLYLANVFNNGISFKFDTSDVRNQGVPLKTSGGTAAGPEPLLKLRDFIEQLLFENLGKKLASINVMDICCMIGSCAVKGGVRRAAIITLFDDFDDAMFTAKNPENLKDKPWRQLSNNTMVWYGEEKYIDKLIDNNKKNGEPGILFHKNLITKMDSLGRQADYLGFGVNPCGEIVLLSDEFCNLTEVILRPEHDLREDMYKVRYATILALLQGKLTDYHYISERAIQNQTNDPIIGVSLTGICDCEKYCNDESHLRYMILKNVVNNTVDEFWEYLDYKVKPKANTCIKPSGTVSKLSNTSSGIHARYGKYYISRILIGKESSLYYTLAQQKIPFQELNLKKHGMEGRVFSFAIKSPVNSKIVDDMNVLEQLRMIYIANKYWCDHNVSATVYIDDDEWDELKEILKKEHNFISLSFLPKNIKRDTSGFAYLPLEKCNKETYEQMAKVQNDVDMDAVFKVEENYRNNDREFACTGGSCSF
jgi:ribonucleoside-diphosphate reductase alpha chain